MPQPQRSATASIRGYLYQTVLAAQAWVTLAEGETLVVDLVLKGRQTSVQVKDRSDTVASLDTPSLLRAVRAFARIYAEKGDAVRFVYVSTQSRKVGRQADHLANWQAISAGKGAAPELVAAVAAAVEERAKDWGLDWQTEDWCSFVCAVRFEFDRDGVANAKEELRRLLRHDRNAADIAHVAELPHPPRRALGRIGTGRETFAAKDPASAPCSRPPHRWP